MRPVTLLLHLGKPQEIVPTNNHSVFSATNCHRSNVCYLLTDSEIGVLKDFTDVILLNEDT